MRIIIVLVFFVSSGLSVVGQERVFTLSELIDSMFARRVELRLLALQHVRNLNGLSLSVLSSPEISYREGYMYSDEREREWRIRQEIVSPFQIVHKSKLKNDVYNRFKADSLLEKKQLTAELKKCYFACTYRYLLYKHYSTVFEMIDRMLGGISFDSMDWDIEGMYSQWLLKMQDSYYDWLEAQNQLQYLAGISVLPIPADTSLELYQIEPISDTITRTPARLFYNAYRAKIQYEDSYASWLKKTQWPTIFFDLSLRNNASRQNLMALQVGIRIPLTMISNNPLYHNAIINKKTSEYEWQKQKEEIAYRSESLIIQLNKYFARVNFYRNRILPTIQKNAFQKLSEVLDNKLGIAVGLHDFLLWQTYYVDYLTAIYEYNKLAVELELLAY